MIFRAVTVLFSLVTPLFSEETVEFNRDIQPILSDKCFHCHGPDSAKRKAGLRLDREEVAKAPRKGVTAIVPGKPESSELVKRIFHKDPDEVMPPPESKRTLSNKEKAVLRRWIASGAEWQAHWSFVPPKKQPLPSVQKKNWPQNGTDYFILSRLEKEGLTPSSRANKETLIRRASLDLTGLPPTPDEVDAFLADKSAKAFEKVLDRLLKSDRYGEHMALMWLDAARYADTDGYQNDGPRYMWRWRDWVIDAYNKNMPFDQFTIEQLAGDLLPAATLEQKIATGFNRNHRYNSESGLVLEEFRLENAVDRVDTNSTVWMGLTMGCARCHDHKYDPFSTKEYYKLISFFDKIGESGRAVKFGNSEPWVVAPTKEQQARLEVLKQKEEQARKALKDSEQEIASALLKWEAARKSEKTKEATAVPETETVDEAEELISESLKKKARRQAKKQKRGKGQQAAGDPSSPEKTTRVVARGLTHYFNLDSMAKGWKATQGNPTLVEGKVGKAVAVDGNSVLSVGVAGAIAGQSRLTVSFWMNPEDTSEGVIMSRQGRKTTRPGLAVEIYEGHLRYFIITRWIAGVGAVETTSKLKTGEWVHVTLTNDGCQSARGMHIFLNGKKASSRIIFNTNSNKGGIGGNTPLLIGGGVHGKNFAGLVDDVRFYNRTLFEDEIATVAVPDQVEQIISIPAVQRSDSQSAKLKAWYLEHASSPPIKRLDAAHYAARTARLKYWDSLPTSMIMEDQENAPPTHVRIRGVYNRHGEEVTAGTPEVFPPINEDYPRNRIGFARWLVDGKHPLTARVAVNRYWQKYFGTGMVKTSEDFGIQGEQPSHPRLLDWLAIQFVKSGWNVKAFQKLILMSATYQQASKVSPDLLRRDPANRLLARGTRFRLPGHVIRDQALAVSGLLTEKIGGPSVSPYQPARLWRELSNMTYRQSTGPDLYRRSIYTIWKRTVVPPSMAVLDAADRESCSVRAKRTNTPLQALTLLNETAFVESARKLATRMMTEGKENPVVFAFRSVTSRHPSEEELSLLNKARNEYLKDFQSRPADAKNLITIGSSKPPATLNPVELAANTALANVLLNLDEVITKE